jgi:hypothetical protein
MRLPFMFGFITIRRCSHVDHRHHHHRLLTGSLQIADAGPRPGRIYYHHPARIAGAFVATWLGQ